MANPLINLREFNRAREQIAKALDLRTDSEELFNLGGVLFEMLGGSQAGKALLRPGHPAKQELRALPAKHAAHLRTLPVRFKQRTIQPRRRLRYATVPHFYRPNRPRKRSFRFSGVSPTRKENKRILTQCQTSFTSSHPSASSP